MAAEPTAQRAKQGGTSPGWHREAVPGRLWPRPPAAAGPGRQMELLGHCSQTQHRRPQQARPMLEAGPTPPSWPLLPGFLVPPSVKPPARWGLRGVFRVPGPRRQAGRGRLHSCLWMCGCRRRGTPCARAAPAPRPPFGCSAKKHSPDPWPHTRMSGLPPGGHGRTSPRSHAQCPLLSARSPAEPGALSQVRAQRHARPPLAPTLALYLEEPAQA